MLRGSKIIIPQKLRKRILELGHEGHPGEVVMKRRLRCKVWWPKIDKHVEDFVKRCRGCLLVTACNRPAPMLRKVLPEGPWLDVAIDFLGPLPTNEYLLIIIDYYSRYQEIEIMNKITSTETINRLDSIFCRLGYPKSITADNGRQFISNEFKSYCKENNIELNSTIPYWPQQNGEVERQNRSVLKRLKISHSLKLNWKQELKKYLMMYNTSPHSTTGKTPTELLIGRTIRDRIPSFQDWTPNEELIDLDKENKSKGKIREDVRRNAFNKDIYVGYKVLAKNVVIQNKLTPAFGLEEYSVVSKSGSELTIKRDSDGKEFKRNEAHLKKIPASSNNASTEDSLESPSTATESLEPFDNPEIMESSSELESSNSSAPENQKTPIKLKLKKKGEMWYTAT
jgi:transposase InsO family protein